MFTEAQRQFLLSLTEDRDSILVNNLLWQLEKEVQQAHQGLHSKDKTLQLLNNQLLKNDPWRFDQPTRERIKTMLLAILEAPYSEQFAQQDIPDHLNSFLSTEQIHMAVLRNPTSSNDTAQFLLHGMSKKGLGQKALRTWQQNPQSMLIGLEKPETPEIWKREAGPPTATYTFHKLRAALKPLENLKGTAYVQNDYGEASDETYEIDHPGVATLVDFLDKTLSGGPLVVAGTGRNSRYRTPAGFRGGWMSRHQFDSDIYETDYPVVIGPELLLNDPEKYSDQKGHPSDISNLVSTVRYHSEYGNEG